MVSSQKPVQYSLKGTVHRYSEAIQVLVNIMSSITMYDDSVFEINMACSSEAKSEASIMEEWKFKQIHFQNLNLNVL